MNKIRREKIQFEWFWTQIINRSYQLWRFLLVDDWHKTQSGSDNDDGKDNNDANDDVNGADYNKEGLRTSELRTYLNNDGDITINATLINDQCSVDQWSCFLTQRIIGQYFKDKWRKRWKKCDCGPKWLSSIRLPRMPWFLTPNLKRVEGQQRNGLKFVQVFGAVCSGSRWLQYKIAAVGGLHLLYSIQALIWAHYWFWEEMNLVITSNMWLPSR